MSTHRKLEYALFVLGIGGVLFSGYLSAVKFFTETCAFNESCPYFLGFPACYFGFLMFTIIALFAGLHVFHLYDGQKANQIVLSTSLLGIVFAGYFTLGELPLLMQEGLSAYLLGLPTCALGLIFYCIVALLSFRLRRDFTN
jgi:uncharacterized membrane protein